MVGQKENRGYLIRLANADDKLGYLAIADWYASIPQPSAQTEQEFQAKMTGCMHDLVEKAKRLHPEKRDDFSSIAHEVKEELILRIRATRGSGLRAKHKVGS